MKAVVIGAAGHIGTYLTPMLVKEGYDVVAVTRTDRAPYEDDPTWRYAQRMFLDRDHDPEFIEKIRAMRPDVVVDLVNFDVRQTRAMIEGLSNSTVSHYLYCSSCWAHGRARVVPFDPDDVRKEPICDYGRDKFASEQMLKEAWRQDGFPATIVMPGQISGPGWDIIGPWGNTSYRPFQLIAEGKPVALPNFGQEIIHNVHGYDVAQVFARAISRRTQALGECFDAVADEAVTTYGYARHLYEYFGQQEAIEFLPWPDWCEYEGDDQECEHAYLHLARSGSFSTEKPRRLLGYEPKYTVFETIDAAVRSYIDRGIIRLP